MNNKSISVLLLVSLTLFGCSSQKLKNTDRLEAEAIKLALATEITPEQALQEATEAMNDAALEELDFYSPLHMKEAGDAFSEAQKLIKKDTGKSKSIQESFKVKQIVKDGLKNKNAAKEILSRSVDSLTVLKELDAPKLFSSEYKSRREDVIDLFIMIESGGIKDVAKKENDVLKKLAELEIKAIYEKYISPADKALLRAKDDKADDLAAVTYKNAVTEIRKASDYIKTNYKDRKAVEKLGQDALREANHAYYVAKEVLELKGMSVDLAETRVLHIESLFEKINQSMNMESGIGSSLSDQAEKIFLKAKANAQVIANMGSQMKDSAESIMTAEKANEEKQALVDEKIRLLEQDRDLLKSQLEQANLALAKKAESKAKTKIPSAAADKSGKVDTKVKEAAVVETDKAAQAGKPAVDNGKKTVPAAKVKAETENSVEDKAKADAAVTASDKPAEIKPVTEIPAVVKQPEIKTEPANTTTSDVEKKPEVVEVPASAPEKTEVLKEENKAPETSSDSEAEANVKVEADVEARVEVEADVKVEAKLEVNEAINQQSEAAAVKP